jgi:hypothetical protein
MFFPCSSLMALAKVSNAATDAKHDESHLPGRFEFVPELAGRRAATIDELLLAGRLPAVKQAEDWNGHASPDASEWGFDLTRVIGK